MIPSTHEKCVFGKICILHDSHSIFLKRWGFQRLALYENATYTPYGD